MFNRGKDCGCYYYVNDTLTDTICSFFLPYPYGDSLFYETGIYDFDLHSTHGCDSAHIHLDLTVLETHTDTLEYFVCNNNFPFELDSVNTYEEAGTYYIKHDDTLRCHSITVLILHGMPFHDDTVTVDLCDVELPYAFADSLFSETTEFDPETYDVLAPKAFDYISEFVIRKAQGQYIEEITILKITERKGAADVKAMAEYRCEKQRDNQDYKLYDDENKRNEKMIGTGVVAVINNYVIYLCTEHTGASLAIANNYIIDNPDCSALELYKVIVNEE